MRRKKIVTVLFAAVFASQMLAGCGNNAQPTMADSGVVTMQSDTPAETEAPEASVEPTAEPTASPTEAPTPEPTAEPTPEPPKDWLEAQGIEITPQGDFTYTTIVRDANKVDLDTFEVLANVVITESTDGVEDGYKEVTIVLTQDMGAATDVTGASSYQYWSSAFDRYTGISFEFDSTSTHLAVGQSSSEEGFVTIVNGDTSYDVSISFESVNEFPIVTRIMTVTCPVDYDGVVFQVGYNDSKLSEANQAIDYTARLYTIDELPYYGDGYYYFSYSNE